MMKKLIGIFIFLACSIPLYAANPASKEYVDLKAAALQTQINAINNIPKIGQCYLGGVVFYIDNTKHQVLISALTDSNVSLANACGGGSEQGTYKWACTVSTNSATGLKMFQGRTNTTDLFSAPITQYPAAYAAYYYAGATNTDAPGTWYLPARDELIMLWDVLGDPNSPPACAGWNNFANNNYWSSSDSTVDSSKAWNIFFGPPTGAFYGAVGSDDITSDLFHVRAIKAFSY